ncbi:hypothetical protein AGLY_001161 [Aphis glycines]|uniref:Uncharacterized protein n=1 Tax=Aphis glycines TaxID=307491 RepID=A0A6G0U917_APHGL|nr:hypothetical protein AGLY_001161 [Aphis glycines]
MRRKRQFCSIIDKSYAILTRNLKYHTKVKYSMTVPYVLEGKLVTKYTHFIFLEILFNDHQSKNNNIILTDTIMFCFHFCRGFCVHFLHCSSRLLNKTRFIYLSFMEHMLHPLQHNSPNIIAIIDLHELKNNSVEYLLLTGIKCTFSMIQEEILRYNYWLSGPPCLVPSGNIQIFACQKISENKFLGFHNINGKNTVAEIYDNTVNMFVIPNL